MKITGAALFLLFTVHLYGASTLTAGINGNSTFQNFLDRHSLSGHSKILKRLQVRTDHPITMSEDGGIIKIGGHILRPTNNPFKFILNGKKLTFDPYAPISSEIEKLRKYINIRNKSKFSFSQFSLVPSLHSADPGSGGLLGAIWGVGTFVSFLRCRNNRDLDHLTLVGCAVRGAFWPLRALFGGSAQAATMDSENPLMLSSITCESPMKAEFLNSSGEKDTLEVTKQPQSYNAVLNKKLVGGIGGSVNFFLDKDFKTTLIQERMIGLERENQEYSDEQKRGLEILVQTVVQYCDGPISQEQKDQMDDFMRLNEQASESQQQSTPSGSRSRRGRRRSNNK